MSFLLYFNLQQTNTYMNRIYHEITPLTPHDCFTYFKREKTFFDFPLHSHVEYEINLILNANGAKRLVGDHSEEISGTELVLVGSNLPHTWTTHNYVWQPDTTKINEITIQFHQDLFEEKLLGRNQMVGIKTLLENANRGVLFDTKTAERIEPIINKMMETQGFDSLLLLFSLLNELAKSSNYRLLCNESFMGHRAVYGDNRMEKAFVFFYENYQREITLEEVAQHVGMALVSFNRLIKKSTGKTFVEVLNDIRLGSATRMLIDSQKTVAEIAYSCGFNNVSYFNRLFKLKNDCTPKEFRDNYGTERTFI